MTDTADKLPAWLGPARLGIGLLQGLCFFALYNAAQWETWPATQPPLFAALFLINAAVPLVVIGGLNAMRRQTLTAWAIGLAAIVGLLGWHDLASEGATRRDEIWPTVSVLAAIVITFVGHHLIAAADEQRRWIASYDRYFELGWRHGAQLALSGAFVGAFWTALLLGAALFKVIGINAVSELLEKDWFHFPATTIAFAAAVHLTDLRAGLVRGFRTLGLALLAWLGPVFAGLTAAFLLALPFTGLDPLWDTLSAGAILLSAAAALIILINAAYQDGGEHTSRLFVLRWSTRLAAVLIAPLLALATQALYLRVAQYGWSPERIYAAAALLVGALYALSYLVAAFWRPWMKLLELGNVATAFVVIVVLIAVFTPIADPARLSVADQMQRLRSGAVSAEAFDLIFLRFESGRYGRDAFNAIRADRSTPDAQALAARADTVALYSSVYQARFDQRQSARRSATAPELRFEVLPEGAALPPDFVEQANGGLRDRLWLCRGANASCVARMLDLNGDGVPEVIITGDRRGGAYARGEDDVWTWIGGFEATCRGIMDAMRRGEVAAAPTDYADLTFDGLRIPLERPNACDDEASASR